MNQHWCPGTWGAGLLTGAIRSHIFLFLKEVFFWCFVEIFTLRGTNRLGSGYSTTVSSCPKDDGSSQCPCSQLSPSMPETCWFVPSDLDQHTSCAVCQALVSSAGLVWPVPSILLSSTWQKHHLWAVHVSSRNPKPQVFASTWLVFSTTINMLFFSLKFTCMDFEETLCLPGAFPWDVLFKCTVAHKNGAVALWRI